MCLFVIIISNFTVFLCALFLPAKEIEELKSPASKFKIPHGI